MCARCASRGSTGTFVEPVAKLFITGTIVRSKGLRSRRELLGEGAKVLAVVNRHLLLEVVGDGDHGGGGVGELLLGSSERGGGGGVRGPHGFVVVVVVVGWLGLGV